MAKLKKVARVDTSVLLGRLIRKAAKKGFSIYDVHVRNAGFGIAYTAIQGRRPLPDECVVYAYKSSLRDAVKYELAAWDGMVRG